MGRIRLVGKIWNKNFLSQKNSADGLSEQDMANKEIPSNLLIENELSEDFLKMRLKVKLNSKKKIKLVKANQEKVKEKSERILQHRKEKLEKFKINYIPLCSDEDWESMAAFYAKNSKK